MLLELDYQSKRDYINIKYYDRMMTVKILPVGIDMGQLRSVVSVLEMMDVACTAGRVTMWRTGAPAGRPDRSW
jgi:hypothetical protein